MTTTTVHIGAGLATQRSRGRIGASAGVAFALFLFAGVASLEIPRNATDHALVAWWADSANQRTAVVSMYLFVLAGLAFLVFLGGLRSRLLAAEGGAGEVTWIAVAGGTVFVAMLFVAAASRGVIGFAALSPAIDESPPHADTLRALTQIGYTVTGTSGLLSAALTIAAISWLVFRTALFGRWLAWIGVGATLAVIGASLALSAVFAIPALLVWALAASVALWRGSSIKIA